MTYTDAFDRLDTLRPLTFDQNDEVKVSADRDNLMFRLRRIAYSHTSDNKKISSKQVLELLEAAALAEQTLSEQQERIRYLETLSITDELTGLLNRRGFQQELDRTLSRASRTGDQGVLLICDMNLFKSVNDTYGHLAGDNVLKEVAKTLQSHCRKSDYVARLSGDEFAVLMPNTSPDKATAIVNKLTKVLNLLVVRWGKHKIPVSVSVGHEKYTSSSTATQLLHLADKAMYHSKGSDLTCAGSKNIFLERRPS
ncbi:GGDEF domain-containing protein [Kiloniella antarctica]|uniref:diguanylate cyclase n=1 Tax=Kiloniella antarctica TaxID=1550907 RepID=A0ABW5BQJ1_9PROT